VIVVFGSLNIDLVFALDALPRPGETVLTPAYRTLPGGKGANQAVAAARAGARVVMAGCVGDDPFGRLACAALEQSGVDTSLVAMVAAPTGCAAIGVDRRGENAIMVASGANALARAAQVPDALLGRGTTLLLQREVPVEESMRLARRAKAAGCRVVLNLAPAGEAPRSLLENLDLLVLNEHEAAVLLDGAASDAEPGAALAAVLGVVTLVTRGRAGAAAFEPAGIGFAVDALPIEAVDTTGAGDAFVGVLAAALDRGAELGEAMRYASVGGALACLEAGAQSALPTAAAIERRLAELPAPSLLPRRR
jgi:ribokinase